MTYKFTYSIAPGEELLTWETNATNVTIATGLFMKELRQQYDVVYLLHNLEFEIEEIKMLPKGVDKNELLKKYEDRVEKYIKTVNMWLEDNWRPGMSHTFQGEIANFTYEEVEKIEKYYEALHWEVSIWDGDHQKGHVCLTLS